MSSDALSRVAALVLGTAMIVTGGCRSDDTPTSAEESPRKAIGEPGLERVELSARAVETLGIETAPVVAMPVREEIRATAVIKPNENRLAHVSPRDSRQRRSR